MFKKNLFCVYSTLFTLKFYIKISRRSIKTVCNRKLTCVVGVAKMNVDEVVADADIVVVVGAAVAAVVCFVGMAVDASGETPAVWPTSLGVV